MSEKIKDFFCQAVYERSLLALSFQSVDNYYTMSTRLSDKDFLRPEHRLIWVIMGMLIKRKVARFDSSMILAEAQKNEVMALTGGLSYIDAIVNMERIDTRNIDYYMGKVLDASTKYQLHISLSKDLEDVETNAKNDDISSIDLIGQVESSIMELSLKSKFVPDATNLSDRLSEYIEERKDNPIEYCGRKTGFDILDKRIDGLVPGTLHVICARPKHGKSTFLSCISAYTAYESSEQAPVLYIDTEMPFDQFRPRILSLLSGVPERKIKHGGYSDQEYYNIQQAEKTIENGKFFHEYMPGYNINKITALYKKYKHREDIKLAVFDYIKCPIGADFRNKKEYQLLGDVTVALKDIAGELDIPVFAANQINRQQDIADSDRILRYADVLMFFKPRELKELQEMEENYGKHRVRNFGTYKLIITDSRRGGTTPPEGIGYNFHKKCLQIIEAEEQVINYDDNEHEEKEEFAYNDVLELKKEEVDDSTEGNSLF